jgi:DNA-binding NarL/FixJ family response regulator
MPVRILVVDDHEVVRQGIRTILSARPDWEICGEAVNGQEAIKLAEELRPDAIIMDKSPKIRTALPFLFSPCMSLELLRTPCAKPEPVDLYLNPARLTI